MKRKVPKTLNPISRRKVEVQRTLQLPFALPAQSPTSTKHGSEPGLIEGAYPECRIVSVGKRRDGGTRYWCLEHKADATAKYGRRAKECRYAHQAPIRAGDILSLDMTAYPGGVALWGAVPPVYDTTRQPVDRGIHVHARTIHRGRKIIDATYRSVRISGLPGDATLGTHLLSELDAIYYMVTSVFGYDTKYVECTYCGYAHLDKDWFSVHPHRRHLCAGCGRNFRDADSAIGNPLAGLRAVLPREIRSEQSTKTLNIRQADFPGGIQIWGSNPAIVWTSSEHEEEGIHVHAFKDDNSCPYQDETFSDVVIDGIKLNAIHVRTMMAQSALPHLRGRVANFMCTHCGAPHFAEGELAFAPSTTHRCRVCKRDFPSTGRLRKIISNPFVGVIERLAVHAVRPRQTHILDLLPETL